MSITSILSIAKNAMSASQTALNVTSNNIANVNTKGYARQDAVFEEAKPIPTDVGLMGDGVRITSIRRYCEQYLEDAIAAKNSSLEQQATVEKYLVRVESLLDENNSNLSSSIVDFFNGWQELSTDPTSTAARISIVAKLGENVSATIRGIYNELKALQVELNNNLPKEVEKVNTIISEIANLNQKICESGLEDGEASAYVDRRTELFKELSGKLSVTSIKDSTGGLTVLTEKGKILVDRNKYWNLATIQDDITGLNRIAWQDASGNPYDITDDIGAGTLRALIYIRDEQLQDVFIKNIDDLAESIIREVNTVHEAGVNLNGTTGVAFFEPVEEAYAKNIQVSAAVQGDAKNIAATSSSDNPTDNDIALQIAALGEDTVEIDGNQTTYTSYVSSLTAEVGLVTGNAKDLLEYDQETMAIMEEQRESVSGVSIDEEMANLIKFQYAYQAAARLFTVADDLFKSILEAV
jgi:flagellar hook-associated protein 1